MKKSIKRNENNLLRALLGLALLFSDVTKEAIRNLPAKKPEFWMFFLSLGLLFVILFYKLHHLDILEYFFPENLGNYFLNPLKEIEPVFHAFLGCIVFLLLVIIYFGQRGYFEKKSYQEKLELIDLKNSKGNVPKIIKISKVNENKIELLLGTPGIGRDRFKSKKSDLEAAFGKIVENISPCQTPSFLKIYLTSKILPNLCLYEKLIPSVTKPYRFLIGESLSGVETKCIGELPHILIAGTTGCGKSVFFKQMLLSLLEKSSHIQLFLLDLKSGVEMKEFAELPNVQVAKNETEAVFFLKKVNQEMKKRFQYLEQKGYKSIDPIRDKKDILVVGTDEASVLYGLQKRRCSENHLTEKARNLTDNLAKLSRAAGIHLIFATQKVTQSSIDTKVQENLEGRMIFRMNTLQGSLTVLGNKTAMDLPDIKGRAIWSSGGRNIEVQAPYISQKTLETRLNNLNAEWERQDRQIFQPELMKQETPDIDGAVE